jgi:hypothetical protein
MRTHTGWFMPLPHELLPRVDRWITGTQKAQRTLITTLHPTGVLVKTEWLPGAQVPRRNDWG